MKLEQKIIEGVLHYRWYEDADFKPYTENELTAIIEDKEKLHSEMIEVLKMANTAICNSRYPLSIQVRANDRINEILKKEAKND